MPRPKVPMRAPQLRAQQHHHRDQKVELKASLSDSAGHLSQLTVLTLQPAENKSYKLPKKSKIGDAAINALHSAAPVGCLALLFASTWPSQLPAHACQLAHLHPAIRFPIELHPPEQPRSLYIHHQLDRPCSLSTALLGLLRSSRHCLCGMRDGNAWIGY